MLSKPGKLPKLNHKSLFLPKPTHHNNQYLE